MPRNKRKAEYSWSISGERYEGRLPTREAAIAEARETHGPQVTVWTGVAIPYAPDYRISGWRIAEELGEAAADHVGEVADEWPDLSNSEEESLELAVAATLERWFKKNKKAPTFWSVEEIEEHRGVLSCATIEA